MKGPLSLDAFVELVRAFGNAVSQGEAGTIEENRVVNAYATAIGRIGNEVILLERADAEFLARMAYKYVMRDIGSPQIAAAEGIAR